MTVDWKNPSGMHEPSLCLSCFVLWLETWTVWGVVMALSFQEEREKSLCLHKEEIESHQSIS